MMETNVSTTEPSSSASMSNTKSNKIVICKWSGCFDMATVDDGFCRLHYLVNWRKIKSKEAKKCGKGLDEYIKELSNRFPEEFFEKLRNEIEEMSAEAADHSDDSSQNRSSIFDSGDVGDNMDTIIKGIRVEDY